jgi:O-antigen/teichoic acid export membrane protein
VKVIFPRELWWRTKLLRDKLTSAKSELLWVVTGQVLSAVAALVGVRLMTSLLNPVAYGELALAMTVAFLISQSLYGPLTNGIARFFAPASEAGGLGDYLRASWRLAGLLTLAILALAMVLTVVAEISGAGRWVPIGLVTLLFSILTGFAAIISGVQNAARQRAIVALHQAAAAWARFGFAACLIIWLGAASTIALVGYSLGTIAVLASQIAFVRKIPAVSIGCNQDMWRDRILSYSLPFYSWALFSWAQQSSDRWALALYTQTADVGLYAALYQLGNSPVSLAATMALQLLAPIFYQRAGDGTNRARNLHVAKLGWYCALGILSLTGLLVLCVSFLHAEIFHLFAAKKYASVSPLLPYMFLASGVFVASQLLELSLMSQMKLKMMIMAKISAACVGVCLNFVGAYVHGIEGVVAAGVVTSVFYFTWVGLLSRNSLAQNGSKNAL